MKKKINIALASSCEWARYARVLLMSLFETNQEYEIDIYFMYLKEDEEDIIPILSEFNDYAKQYHNRVIPLMMPEKYIDDRINHKQWHPLTYARHAIYQLLPDDVDRIILMGIDMLIRENIGEIYFSNFEKYLKMAASRAMMNIKIFERKNRIMKQKGCGPFEKFYNGDFIVADVAAMKKHFDYKAFIELLVEKDFKLLDEEGLLVMFHEHIEALDWHRWNYILDNEEKLEEVSDAAIIHYVNIRKPWTNYAKNEVMDLWWDYARKTEYYTWYLEQNILLNRKSTVNNETQLRERLSASEKLFFLASANVKFGQALSENNIQKIAVYGHGSFGKYFLDSIKDSGIETLCIIDTNPDIDSVIMPKVFLDDKDLQAAIDAIIITSIGYYDEVINTTLSGIQEDIRILTLTDIFEDFISG